MSFQRGDKAHVISGNNIGKVVEVVSVRPGGVAVYNKNANRNFVVSPNSLRVVFNANKHGLRRGNRKTRRNRRGNRKTRRNRR